MKSINSKKIQISFMRNLTFLLLAIALTFFFLPKIVYSLKNAAAVYCEALNYTFLIKSTPLGEDGYCQLPNGTEVEAWDFLQGKVAQDYSYCKKIGYDIKTVNYSAYCVLPNGTEVEVTQLMGLSFEETTCGDGVCGMPENYNTCPKDCPSGSYDGYCDGVADSKCDQDCVDKGTPQLDPDCPVCGNDICEGDKGENYNSCPSDCQKAIVCGNNVCDSNETQDNCCMDCGCQNDMTCVDNKCISEKCGDGKCDSSENYGNCPSDCPSGLRDGYCDGVKDGLCDPDCQKNQDPDCSSNRIWIYAVIGIVIAALLFFIFSRMRVRSEGETV
jgi:putative hemolysin